MPRFQSGETWDRQNESYLHFWPSEPWNHEQVSPASHCIYDRLLYSKRKLMCVYHSWYKSKFMYQVQTIWLSGYNTNYNACTPHRTVWVQFWNFTSCSWARLPAMQTRKGGGVESNLIPATTVGRSGLSYCLLVVLPGPAPATVSTGEFYLSLSQKRKRIHTINSIPK